MKFRPCIDIHDGKVKQLVGGSLTDDSAGENFVSEKDAAHYAGIYKENNLSGGHIVLLNPKGTEEYDLDVEQAMGALKAYPGGMQIGGGLDFDSAKMFIEAGASHAIFTSWLFENQHFSWERLKTLSTELGKEKVVVDISCRKRDGNYYVVKDRWQTFTDMIVGAEIIENISQYADEILIHAVDQEGLRLGIDDKLIRVLAERGDSVTMTYAGGIRNLDDISRIYENSNGNIDFSVGSALSLFGGDLDIEEVISFLDERI